MMNTPAQEMIEKLRVLLDLDSLPKIQDQVLRKKLSDQFLLDAETQTTPQLFAIGGGPGSGKSYFYEKLKLKNQLPANAVIHDPDLVMQLIPGYQADANIDPVKAFERWELPARQLANEILFQATVARYNIIYIKSFALEESLNLVSFLKKIKYKVDIHMLICHHDIALERVLEREKISKRHIPKELLLQRHEKVLQLLPEIRVVSDNYYCYENNEEPVLTESILETIL